MFFLTDLDNLLASVFGFHQKTAEVCIPVIHTTFYTHLGYMSYVTILLSFLYCRLVNLWNQVTLTQTQVGPYYWLPYYICWTPESGFCFKYAVDGYILWYGRYGKFGTIFSCIVTPQLIIWRSYIMFLGIVG